MKRIIASLLCAVLVFGATACNGGKESVPASLADTEVSETTTKPASSGKDYLAGHETFEATSTDLVDSVWADITSNTLRGSNSSPALSWAPVEGAAAYAVYMVDMSTNGFLHWKSNGITETELPTGWAPASDYIGAYPPEGSTHVYDVYIIALRTPVERLKGGINSQNPKFEEFINAVDTDDAGNTGNIVAYCRLSGTFTA